MASQVRLDGYLFKRCGYAPSNQKHLDEGRSLDDPDCLLFDLLDTAGEFAKRVSYPLKLRRTGRPLEEEGESSSSEQAVLTWVEIKVSKDVTLYEDEEFEIAQLPARHLLLSARTIAEPLMRQAIRRQVVTLGLPWRDAVAYLPTLLAELLPTSPLRHVALDIFPTDSLDETEADLVVGALEHSSQIEGIRINCRSDRFVLPTDVELPAFFGALLRRLLHCKTYVAICAIPPFWWDKSSPKLFGRETDKVKQLQCSPWFLEALTPPSSLTRLDILPAKHTELCEWNKLMTICASTNSLTDLGICIENSGQLADLVDRKLHTRIFSLRLLFLCGYTEDIEQIISGCLKDPGCKVQFLSFTGDMQCNPGQSWLSFLDPRQGSHPESPIRLSALRVRGPRGQDEIGDLAKYLCSLAAQSLEFCDVKFRASTGIDGEWEFANSLNNNFALCNLGFDWRHNFAEAYAMSLLRRNRLYRDGKLLSEEQVKPDLAKLFVCGHPRVGKTTLSQALLSLQNDNQWPIPSVFRQCLKRSSDPTRGMEIHPLIFKGLNMKLILCDLAGHEEFHVFHHYFMNATRNDVFIVVCKKGSRVDSTFDYFQQELHYWLRFIVSHRSSRRDLSSADSDENHKIFKPKVIVVANCFQPDIPEVSMQKMANEWTASILQAYSEVLDFDDNLPRQEYKNLFGLNAWTRCGVRQLFGRLEFLLKETSSSSLSIPRLCHHITASLTRSKGGRNRFCSITLPTGTGKSRLLTTFEEVRKALSKHQIFEPIDKIQAALQELHAQGYVIYFPLDETYQGHGRSNNLRGELPRRASRAKNNTLVIIDTNWFSNKLIGSLLGKQMGAASTCESTWRIAEIKDLLREEKCREDMLEEILRYLFNLELCVSLSKPPGNEERLLLFPALVRNRNFRIPEEWLARTTKFFGRRLKCKDPSVHLIPFAVFTRLQVKLYEVYSAKSRSLEIGYGWVSVMNGRVGVVVRFGADGVKEACETKQWVDVLTFCPEDHRSEGSGGYQTTSIDDPRCVQAEKEVDMIRDHLYATCKGRGGLVGIPTVKLEEMVLQNHEAESDDSSLASVLEEARTKGLHEACQTWRMHKFTPVMDLLLPKEIEEIVAGSLTTLQTIKEEFCGGEGEGSKIEQVEQNAEEQEGACESELMGQFEILDRKVHGYCEKLARDVQSYCADVKSEVRIHYGRIQEDLEIIKADIGKLKGFLEKGHREIIANCSTRLLRHELGKDRACPLYPYLVDEEGKLAPLWGFMFGRKQARVRFLCESPFDETPHPVKGQKGKKVTMEWAPWARKAARAVVPVVKVISCLARLAVAMSVPGALPYVPAGEELHNLLGGLGVTIQTLEGTVLPKVMEELLRGVADVEWRTCRPGEEGAQEWVAALVDHMGDVDMSADLGLTRIMSEKHGRTFWVCQDHAKKLPKTELQNIVAAKRST